MNHLLKFCFLIIFLVTGYEGHAQQKPIPYDSLRTVLEGIYEVDQGIRMKMGAVKPEDMNDFFREMQRVDSVNQVKVLAILQRYGWLPQSKIGEKAANGLFFVVQHAPAKVIKQYLPQMQKQVKLGEANKTYAAMMEDRLLMYTGKKQKYGTQATSMLTEDGTMAVWPIKDPVNINKRRKEAGFKDTVEENAKRMNAKYNPDEKLPAQPVKFN
ncbi:DUF6624 domain-containing protein [Rufibacter roseus]|uniref:DUF6624 domain-containing protein n=1 Tax=Rufibacter roseus TaxID=1567108 RepID=A0ABW2DIV1_9BACT|nr:DUF6624 domain-containing protein [Rufibacter roseus]